MNVFTLTEGSTVRSRVDLIGYKLSFRFEIEIEISDVCEENEMENPKHIRMRV